MSIFSFSHLQVGTMLILIVAQLDRVFHWHYRRVDEETFDSMRPYSCDLQYYLSWTEAAMILSTVRREGSDRKEAIRMGLIAELIFFSKITISNVRKCKIFDR